MTVGPALASAFAGWAGLPGLGPALTAPDGLHVVIDPQGGRVLHASPAAAPLAAALAASDGTALARQIARAGAGETAPRLVRLRLDPRGIMAPALCLVASGRRDDGAPLVLVVPAAPVTLPRLRPQRPIDPPPAEPGAVAPPAEAAPVAPAGPKAGDRFVWRSDAADRLTALNGVAGLASLVGRDWQALACAEPGSDPEPLLAALAERKTFRAVPATLASDAGPVAVELSGAPLGRGDAAFSGFGGFGVIRSLPAGTLPKTEAAPRPDAGSPRGPVAGEGAVAAVAAPLSSDEHAAFREIARALGARYAGDEDGPPQESARPRPAGGAVMPFPGGHAEPPPAASADGEASPDAALLDALPVAILVHRGESILAANASLLELSGFADLTALRAAGVARLLRAPSPLGPDAHDWRRTVLETAEGRASPVEMVRGSCAWQGVSAACLILRPLAEDVAGPALAAERLARDVQAARATGFEAALDALQAGVVTVDAEGRVVSLNRAAAEIFDCDPREIVGAGFVGLFDTRSAPGVGEALRGLGDAPRAVSASGRGLSLDVSPARPDGRRVAVLNRTARVEPVTDEPAVAERGDRRPPAEGGDDRRDLLRRLDLSVRAPATDIVELTEAMLKEPFGPLGDPRYRHCVAEIKASGERMLERVRELLDIAAVEAGTLELDPRPLVLNEVVAGCVARLQEEAARGRIVLRTSFSADLTELEADERSVSRAACLVIEHAIRRSSAGGQVIVSTGEAESAQIALRVRDTAAGKTEAASAATGDRGDDLALPRALVEANGGRLRLARRGEEDGTLVEIILPARRASAAGGRA